VEESRSDAQPPGGGLVCPLLGLYSDRQQHLAAWHPDHRCWAGSRPVPIERTYQVAVCTSSGYTTCSTYQAWAWGPAGAVVTPPPEPEPSPGAAEPEPDAAEPEPEPDAAEPEPAGEPEPIPDADAGDRVGADQTDGAEWEAAEVLAVHEALDATATGPAAPAQAETLDDLLAPDPAAGEVAAAAAAVAVAAAAPEPPIAAEQPPATDEAAPEPPAADEPAPEPPAADQGYRYLPPEAAAGAEVAAGAAAVSVAPRGAYPPDAYARIAGIESADDADPEADADATADFAPPDAGPPRGHGILWHLGRSLAILVGAIVVLAALVGVGYVAGRLFVQPGAGPTPAPIVTPAPTSAPATPRPTAPPTLAPTPAPSPSAKPTAKPKPTPTAKPQATTITYRVKSGDTLYSIAAQFGTTIKAIVEANGITDPNTIVVGQKLAIPIP
jgi:hypothetical protein